MQNQLINSVQSRIQSLFSHLKGLPIRLNYLCVYPHHKVCGIDFHIGKVTDIQHEQMHYILAPWQLWIGEGHLTVTRENEKVFACGEIEVGDEAVLRRYSNGIIKDISFSLEEDNSCLCIIQIQGNIIVQINIPTHILALSLRTFGKTITTTKYMLYLKGPTQEPQLSTTHGESLAQKQVQKMLTQIVELRVVSVKRGYGSALFLYLGQCSNNDNNHQLTSKLCILDRWVLCNSHKEQIADAETLDSDNNPILQSLVGEGIKNMSVCNYVIQIMLSSEKSLLVRQSGELKVYIVKLV